MKKWEYKVLESKEGDATDDLEHIFDYNDFTSKLNKLGTEGWEVVSIEGVTQNGYTVKYIALLKREIV